MDLPVEKILPQLCAFLRKGGSVILKAPPGAGKTTLVPLALLKEPWLKNGKIIVLEPRRLAARSAAYRMSELLNETVGKTVGYRTRTDSKISRDTKIEVVTEGIFSRQILANPELDNVAAVIFDEFHERSIHTDLGLALALDARTILRDDLKIIIMSATLDPEKISPLFENPQVLTCEGRMFEVKTESIPKHPRERLEDIAVRAVAKAISSGPGSILCFLPGIGEIRRVEEKIRSGMILPDNTILCPLYGDLDKKEQDAAIRPAPLGKRKIVLATSIAESSITIGSITVVIDSGLSRKSVFDPRTGMSHLETVRVSKASADQRRGRAGRTAPGTCYRLWADNENSLMPDYDIPEILESDLANLALFLADWGVTDASKLKWLDLPPSAEFAQSVELLKNLGALDINGKITRHGKKMIAAGTHPRLANMNLQGSARSIGSLACDIAAILEERDFIKFSGGRRDSDIRTRLRALREGRAFSPKAPFLKDSFSDGSASHPYHENIDNSAKSRVKTLSDDFRQRLGIAFRECDTETAGILVGFAYPDRIAKRREGNNPIYLLSCGRSAKFAEPESISKEELLAIAELDDRDKDPKIILAAPVTRRDLDIYFGEMISTVEKVEWDDKSGAVIASGRRMLGKIILEEYPLKNPDTSKISDAISKGIKTRGISCLCWNDESENLRRRIEFAATIDGKDGWPDTSDNALLENLDEWLRPFLNGIRKLEDMKRINLKEALEGMLGWKLKEKLEKLVPARLKVASGSMIKLNYTEGKGPILEVKVQELFGTKEHPRIFNGKIPVLIRILSPSMRPVQTTSDLVGFWNGSYQLVKKDLKGRYPKHYWPENPMESPACGGARPKR